ncbi:hypothetical protein DPEC_G00087480 [Dallia pectoralis]|uniref:Uncharacterized protein n=1 Tax=Dallia pectoralis TaxID=75939 RepID=A0ACC2H053_DALPE|nr:hypothetical protein DPEC_G00087480 [Dallia pectoralis]
MQHPEANGERERARRSDAILLPGQSVRDMRDLLSLYSGLTSSCSVRLQASLFLLMFYALSHSLSAQRVAKKFDLPTMDVKVLDVSKTEIDEEAFEYLLSIPDLGVLEIHIPGTASLNESFSSSSFGDTAGSSGSDDTVILELSPFEINRAEDSDLSQMTENILKSSPGGEKVINEYSRTKSLSDGRRRDMVKILVAHMTNEHGTSPSRPMKEEYAKGIISLFAYLADPKSNLGYAGTATCLPF